MGFFGGINQGLNQARQYQQKQQENTLDALVKRAQLAEAGYDIQPGKPGLFGSAPTLVQNPNYQGTKVLEREKLGLENEKLRHQNRLFDTASQGVSGIGQIGDQNSPFVLNPTTGTAEKNPAYVAPEKLAEHQDALEKEYADRLTKQLSNRSGGLGMQDAKVNQAIHLRNLLDQYYDEKNGSYNVPSSQYEELAIGLANLVSGGNSPTESMVNGIRQRTAKGDLGGAITYITGTPQSGSTPDIFNNLAESIDRQGLTSEDLRNQAVSGLKQLRPTKLEQARADALEKAQLGNSYKAYLEKSPSRKKVPAWAASDPQAYLEAKANKFSDEDIKGWFSRNGLSKP